MGGETVETDHLFVLVHGMKSVEYTFPSKGSNQRLLGSNFKMHILYSVYFEKASVYFEKASN